jgi:hypothetical protein
LRAKQLGKQRRTGSVQLAQSRHIHRDAVVKLAFERSQLALQHGIARQRPVAADTHAGWLAAAIQMNLTRGVRGVHLRHCSGDGLPPCIHADRVYV